MLGPTKPYVKYVNLIQTSTAECNTYRSYNRLLSPYKSLYESRVCSACLKLRLRALSTWSSCSPY